MTDSRAGTTRLRDKSTAMMPLRLGTRPVEPLVGDVFDVHVLASARIETRGGVCT